MSGDSNIGKATDLPNAHFNKLYIVRMWELYNGPTFSQSQGVRQNLNSMQNMGVGQDGKHEWMPLCGHYG